MKTTELTGITLDWAVAKCEGLLGPDGIRFSDEYCDSLGHGQDGDFTNDWAQGGKIIEREGISIGCHLDGAEWFAKNYWAECEQSGSTPLVAAMRCYVASKLGDEISLPEELNV
jgi:hypothetical protein